MNATTRAVRFHSYGNPLDVLVEEDAEVPVPGVGQLRVHVAATGLNPADWAVCGGFMAGSLPRGIGFDVAGTVDALGDDVSDVAPGDLVFGTADVTGQASGGVADVAILREWAAVPDGLGVSEAAAMPMVVKTAHWTLGALGVRAGDTVVIHGAGAMVGYAAVQIALELGARVLATAGPTYADELAGLGADVTPRGEGMVERLRALADGPIDLVLDTAPPTPGTVAQLLRLVDEPANVVTISNHSDARELGARVNLDLLRDAATTLTSPPELLARYAAKAAAGRFRIPVGRTFPLDRWRDAVELSISGNPRGKVILAP